jgi:hypothetical protein
MRRAALVLFAALILSACQARVTTTVVAGADGTGLTVAVVLTGAAADSVLEDPAAEARLLNVFSDATGAAPALKRGEGRWEATVAVPADRVGAAGPFTAVWSVTRSADGDSVAVAVAPPSEVIEALDAAAAGRPDTVDLRAALGAGTLFEVEVVFPGGVSAAPADLGGVPLERFGDRVRLSFSADETPTGVLVVSGDPSAPWSPPGWAPHVALVAGLVVAGYAVRRYQRGASR